MGSLVSSALGIEPGTEALMGKVASERVLRQDDLPALAPHLMTQWYPTGGLSALDGGTSTIPIMSLRGAVPGGAGDAEHGPPWSPDS